MVVSPACAAMSRKDMGALEEAIEPGLPVPEAMRGAAGGEDGNCPRQREAARVPVTMIQCFADSRPGISCQRSSLTSGIRSAGAFLSAWALPDGQRISISSTIFAGPGPNGSFYSNVPAHSSSEATAPGGLHTQEKRKRSGFISRASRRLGSSHSLSWSMLKYFNSGSGSALSS